MTQWATVAGLALTGIGIIIGFYLPKIGAVWSGPLVRKKEKLRQIRFVIGICCVLSGTVLQILGAWPPR